MSDPPLKVSVGDGFDYADFAVQLAGVSSLAAGDVLA
jgi:hypothetical protein